jgi:hypothetical protein
MSPSAIEVSVTRLALLALLALAACGADGAPTPPSGITISGEASAGVTSGRGY